MPKIMLMLFFINILFLDVTSVFAHSTSKSNVLIELKDAGRVSVRIRLDEKDVLDLVDVDLSSSREQETANVVLSARFNQKLKTWLYLAADGIRCPLRFLRYDEPALRKIDVYGEAQCVVTPQRLRLQWNLGKGERLDLVAFVAVYVTENIKHKTVLSKKRSQISFRVGHPSLKKTFKRFFLLGVEHILLGWDHLAFLLTLLLSCSTRKRLLFLVTSFTVAHSVTLFLAATGMFRLPLSLVEPAIALSISIAAVVGFLFLRDGKSAPPGSSDKVKLGYLSSFLMAVSFGLLHGLGFAAMLQEALFDAGSTLLPLFSFNAGVEVGQAFMVLLAFPLLVFVGKKNPSNQFIYILYGCLMLLGAYWFSERLLTL